MDYRTPLFDSRTLFLAFSPTEYYLSCNRPEGEHAHPFEAHAEQVDDEWREDEDMELSSGDDEAD